MARGSVGSVAALIALPFICVQHGAGGRDILREQVVAGPFGTARLPPKALPGMTSIGAVSFRLACMRYRTEWNCLRNSSAGYSSHHTPDSTGQESVLARAIAADPCFRCVGITSHPGGGGVPPRCCRCYPPASR
jgi:hypothetical protein